MNITEFISNYKNHPVLFVGTGLSLRYLANSYTWDGLLAEISQELKENEEFYLDIKAKCTEGRNVNYAEVGQLLEEEFNNSLIADRNGKFKEVNDMFYQNMVNNIKLSRFKIYVAKKTETLNFRERMKPELQEFRKTRKNIGSIITTNYDKLVEEVFAFNPLIGNEILLSNPYGSVYKIHGCCNVPERIIISTSDYLNFEEKYHLIRAQLLSLFIHNPIIFLGYSVSDENIKKILKTIFTYVQPNSELASAPPGVPLCRSWCYHQENQRTNRQSSEAPFILTRNSLKSPFRFACFIKTVGGKAIIPCLFCQIPFFLYRLKYSLK